MKALINTLHPVTKRQSKRLPKRKKSLQKQSLSQKSLLQRLKPSSQMKIKRLKSLLIKSRKKLILMSAKGLKSRLLLPSLLRKHAHAAAV